MSRISLRIENLEQRRLMDADGMTCSVVEHTASDVAAMSLAAATGSVRQTAAGEDESTDLQLETGLKDRTPGLGADANLPIWCFAGYPSAQVYRSGSTVVAIANADFRDHKSCG